MNTSSETDLNPLDPKNREQVVGLAKQLLKSNSPGILSTIDQRGFPQSRWMATMSFDDFPDLYTLTAANSRKIDQIQMHPRVQWMFSNSDLSFILNLTGRAEIYLHEAAEMVRIWRQITDKSRAFFMGESPNNKGFAVIHTKVEAIECTFPRKVLRFSIDPREMSSS
jgi:general stress protein 26